MLFWVILGLGLVFTLHMLIGPHTKMMHADWLIHDYSSMYYILMYLVFCINNVLISNMNKQCLGLTPNILLFFPISAHAHFCTLQYFLIDYLHPRFFMLIDLALYVDNTL